MTKNDLREASKSISKVKNKKVLNDIINSSVLGNFNIIGIYFPLKNEYDILDLIKAYPNKRFAFPRVIDKDNIIFIEAVNTSDFEKAAFGLYEPKFVKEFVIKRDLIECFIIPCIAVSKGKRIGFGAGYYDKYLEGYKGKIIGVVNSKSVVNHVDMDSHDIFLENIFEGE